MAIELNHTIVPARDPRASAQFPAGILGLLVGPPASHFTPVTPANGVTLDFDHSDEGHPIKRLGTVQDVASTAAFLASGNAAWITGVVLDVAGGAVLA